MSIEFLEAVIFDGLFAAVAAIGFSVISNPPRKAIYVSALLAAVGHGLRFFLMKNTSLDIGMASFFAAFSIGLFSIFFAKIIRCPAEVFSFPSLLPMIPGMYAYKTVLSLVKFMEHANDDTSAAIMVDIFRNGITTVFILFALVIGAAIPMFIFYKQSFMMTRLLK